MDKFFDQGLEELGAKLGPLLWQFANTKRFDPDDFEAFLALLPKTLGKQTLRHAVEVRHDSFCTPAFPALLRKYKVGCVYARHATYPEIADLTADFVYARLQTGSDDVETAYESKDLDAWARRLKTCGRQGKRALAGSAPRSIPNFTAPGNPR